MTIIELTDQEVELFIVLRQADVFGLTNGSITIDFDHQGVPQQVRTNRVAYKKKNIML